MLLASACPLQDWSYWRPHFTQSGADRLQAVGRMAASRCRQKSSHSCRASFGRLGRSVLMATGDFCFRCPLGRKNISSSSFRRPCEEGELLMCICCTLAHAEAVALQQPWAQHSPKPGSSLHPSLGLLKDRVAHNNFSWGRSPVGPCMNGMFQLATSFGKISLFLCWTGERPLSWWVECKSLLSHCSEQTPTKSRSNYFLQ